MPTDGPTETEDSKAAKGAPSEPSNEDDAEDEAPSAQPKAAAPDDALKPAPPMLRTILYGALFVGLVASAILAVDYTQATPVFCDEISTGCGAVRHSSYASLLGIPTPFIGMGGFALLLVFALRRGPMARNVFVGLGTVGVAAGAFFLLMQKNMGQFCKFCVLVDISSLLIGAIAYHRFIKGWDDPAPERPRIIRGAVLLAIAGLVIPVGRAMPKAMPAPIAKEIAATPAGQVTVVDFVDFECPFCRQMHAQLKPMLDEHAGKYRLVRKQVPLARHPHALQSAKAAICAENMGKGDVYAELLIEMPEDDMIDFGLQKLARQVGIRDDAAFAACMKSPETEARIKADRADYDACKGHGLPMIYIGPEQLFGLMKPEEVRAALGRAFDK